MYRKLSDRIESAFLAAGVCPRCAERQAAARMFPGEEQPEAYSWPEGDDRIWAWDVVEARRILAGRPAEVMPADVVARLVEMSMVDGNLVVPHVGHVDPAAPGVWVHFRSLGGEEAGLLIDGIHRAARSLIDQTPFRVLWLDEAEMGPALLGKGLTGAAFDRIMMARVEAHVARWEARHAKLA